MAVNVKKLLAAGFDRMYYAINDSVGYAFGNTGIFVVGADGLPMLRLDGVKTADISIPEPTVLQATGDDQALGTFIFPPNELPSFTIEVAINDLTFAALAQSTKVKNLGNMSVGVLAPSDPTYPDFSLILVRRSKSKQSGSSGADNWEGVVIPKANLVPLGSGAFTERELATFKYKVTCNIADVMPWGETVTDTGYGTTGGAIFPWSAANRITSHAFYGDATEDVFNLAYTPASTSLLDVLIFVNGAAPLTVGATIDATAKTVTFAAPPAANAKIEVLYQHAA